MTDWSEGDVRVLIGDVRERLRELADGSVDALVTDPPAGISFMGREWDTFPTRQRPAGHVFADGRSRPGIAAGQEHRPRTREPFIAWLTEVMVESRRVLKPGAHGLVWAIPRTSHWTATALEDAGFEVRDFICHHFGSGFPKAGKVALKPATEIWWLVRRPLSEQNVAANVAVHGVGELNIDGCRVAATGGLSSGGRHTGSSPNPMSRAAGRLESRERAEQHPAGRWPANLVLSHGEGCEGECESGCPVAELDRQSGNSISRRGMPRHGANGDGWRLTTTGAEYDDDGAASRFFYVAKASTAERNAGLPPGRRNMHPTVKPVALMRYLCRLVTPPGGLILDPFCGSGTTLVAARLEGFRAIGIDRDPESVETARCRVAWTQTQSALDLVDERAPAGPTCAGCARSADAAGPLQTYAHGAWCEACQAGQLGGGAG